VLRSGFVNISTEIDEDRTPVLVNTVCIHGSDHDFNSKPSDTAVVLAHGYGAGVGMWYSSLGGLSRALVPCGYAIYAIDWLGFARSARLPFPWTSLKAPCGPDSQDDHNKQLMKRSEAAEAYFVDSLEKWREKIGVSQLILVGHSLGGYLSAAYAEKYPNRVKRLVLVSPVGIPPAPDVATAHKATNSEEEEIDESTLESLSPLSNDPPVQPPPPPPKKSFLYRAISSLWERGVTPFTITRALGPFGPNLAGWYSHRRFAHLPPDEVQDIQDYIYHSNAFGVPAGELAISSLLRPGAWAYNPFSLRFPKWTSSTFPDTVFLYGDIDWMDYRHAERAKDNLPQDLKSKITIRRVPNAGHQVFLDSPDAFVQMVVPAILGRDIPILVPDEIVSDSKTEDLGKTSAN
jgi:cardiolipin-specific phospholipase